jgi:hypothetical protein
MLELPMTIRRNLYLMTTTLAVAGMIGAPLQAYAQEPGPPGAAPAYDQNPSADPPARVGRLATIQGTVSTHAANETAWSPAVLNAPVSDGDAFWTEPQALAEIEVTASSVWMSESTEFDLTTLNDTVMHASEPQGELYVHLRGLQPGETYTIETPRGTVTMAAEGRYEIGAGDTQTPTTVTVLDGAAQITGNNIALQVHANQTASITGGTTFEGAVGPMSQDAFLAAMLQREQPVAPRGVAPPPVVAQMTGGEDLNAYGSWDTNSDYGSVWYPQVDAGWAPYREGRWSYVAPWGWTWVDAAPWGFAPFHYGRWVQIGPRWGWTPVYPGFGGGYRPVYAPALVGFFGIGVGIGIGVGFGIGAFGERANIGWVPLGPREAYFPPYGASRGYLDRVNVTNIRNTTNIYNEVNTRRSMTINQYANSHAAVVVPARAMVDSRPVNAVATRPSEAQLASTRALVDRAPVTPGSHTLGLTPRAAQQLHVPVAQPTRAPGPQVTPNAARAGAPPLRQATGPAREPAGHGAPGPAIGAPNRTAGTPELRQPGARPPATERTMPAAEKAGAPGPRGETNEAGRPQLRTPGAAVAKPAAETGNAREPAEAHPITPRAQPPAVSRGTPAREPATTHPAATHPAAAPRATSRPQAEPRAPAAPRAEPHARPAAPPRAPAPRPAPAPHPQAHAAPAKPKPEPKH